MGSDLTDTLCGFFLAIVLWYWVHNIVSAIGYDTYIESMEEYLEAINTPGGGDGIYEESRMQHIGNNNKSKLVLRNFPNVESLVLYCPESGKDITS